MSLSPIDFFHASATGPRWRRRLLTPPAFLVFLAVVLAPVWAGLATDRALALPPLFPGPLGVALGAAALALGVPLVGWCVALFVRHRGTPVPVNPPRELVVTGPYAWSRNPMVTGVQAILFGVGFLLHSMGIALLWVPGFWALMALELKLVEEPELERRFGEAYRAYRDRVPMFVPRPPR